MATVFYNNKRSSYFSRSKLTLGDIEDESKDLFKILFNSKNRIKLQIKTEI